MPNGSLLGADFGSIGQDKIVSFDGVVGEMKPGGFVVMTAPSDHPSMLIGAINPADGVSDLAVGDAVRIELRYYRTELGGDGAKRVFIVTRRVER